MKRPTMRMPKRRWQRAVLYASSTVFILAGADMALTRYWRHIAFSRETTYITAPLNAAGTPDYLAWLNEKLSAGVTPENNAAVPIMQAAGTALIDSPEWQHAVMAGVGPPGASYPSKLKPYFYSWAKAQSPGELPADAELELGNQEVQMCESPWNPAEHPLWTQWLQARKEALDLAHQAAGRSRFHVPLVPARPRGQPGESVMALLPYLNDTRALANLLLSDAQCHANDADKTVFIRDLTDALKLGSLLTQRSVLIEYFVGLWIERAAYAAALTALESGAAFTAADARVLRAALDAVPPVGAPDLTGERFVLLDLCCYVSVYGFAHSPFGSGVQPYSAPAMALVVPVRLNAAMRDINRIFDELDASLRLPTYRQRIATVAGLEGELHAGNIARVRWSTALDRVISFHGPGEGPLLVQTCQLFQSASMRRDLMRLTLALLVYKSERGAYPATLDALTASDGGHLLAQIPQDGFSDAPLIYRKEGAGYVLYSVGPDGKDDGGDDKKDEVVRMK